MNGQQIFENFHAGRGPGQLNEAADIIRQVEADYEMWAADVRELTAKMEAAWSGDAGGAARRGAGPLVVEHELARPELTTAQDLTIRQVDSYDQAKNSVQPIPNQPEKPGFWDNVTSFGGASDDYESQMRNYNGANDQNVQVMRQYEDSSNYNASGMPQSYGNLTPDQSEIVIGSEPKTPPPDDGKTPRQWEPPRVNGTDTGGTNSNTPPGSWNTQPSQTTTPNGWTPPPSTLPGQPPVGTPPVNTPPNVGPGYPPPGGWPPGTLPPGSRPPGSQPPGSRPPGGGGPRVGPGSGGTGGPGSGQGMRGGGGGGGFGPGGSGSGGTGAGGGPRSGAMGGSGGMFGGGDHHANQGRGGAGAGGRGGGGMPMGGGGGAGGRGEDDLEHQSPSYLVENDPDAIFGTDEITAPPVIGG
ncbi:hypothetical protein [Actinokineospora xionganensis]|uniref:PPE family protein n=1 Tax=Actinokineospora xionganensis TaxID=2684470 RepID=A0ABR7L269_9PSEU|nr:hypothetical protein [Actinokineospora xionganensis]MBC6446789.1 hypothetical protein [Actinokineospora xionganensis]